MYTASAEQCAIHWATASVLNWFRPAEALRLVLASLSSPPRQRVSIPFPVSVLPSVRFLLFTAPLPQSPTLAEPLLLPLPLNWHINDVVVVLLILRPTDRPTDGRSSNWFNHWRSSVLGHSNRSNERISFRLVVSCQYTLHITVGR